MTSLVVASSSSSVTSAASSTPLRTYVNHTQKYQYPTNKTEGLAGRDFSVLTLSADLFITQWVFPDDFYKSMLSASVVKVFQVIRHTFRFQESDETVMTSKIISAKMPMLSELDCDNFYEGTVEVSKKDLEQFEKEQSLPSHHISSTELVYDEKTEKISLTLQLESGSQIKISLKEKNYRCEGRWSLGEGILDKMLPDAWKEDTFNGKRIYSTHP